MVDEHAALSKRWLDLGLYFALPLPQQHEWGDDERATAGHWIPFTGG